MLSGLHAPNTAIQAVDRAVMQAGHFDTVKLWSAVHGPDDVDRVRAVLPQATIMVRLPDFPVPNVPNLPGTYAAEAWNVISAFHSRGVTLFQVGNEPQYDYRYRKGYRNPGEPQAWAGAEDWGPGQFCFYMRESMHQLWQRIWIAQWWDVRLVSPPLSWSPGMWSLGQYNPTAWTLDQWRSAFKSAPPPPRKGEYAQWQPGKSFYQLFSCVGSNVYWTSEDKIADPSFGASYGELWRDSGGMDVVVCEYGLDTRGAKQPISADQRQAMFASQYHQWLDLLSAAPYAEAAYCFVSPGATPDWDAFKISPQTATSMKL